MVKLYCVDNEHLMRTIFDHILRAGRVEYQIISRSTSRPARFMSTASTTSRIMRTAAT